MQLKQRAKQVLEDRIETIKDFSDLQPNHPFAIANRHMLELSTQTSWNATGVLTMTGVMWWALNLSVDLAPPHSVIFNATGGPDFDFAIFTSVVTGSFFVDPSTLHGKCNFSMESVAGGLGEVSFNLYDMNWSQTGTFLGAVGGLSLAKVSGEGTITYY
jgi:hypothetical protein